MGMDQTMKEGDALHRHIKARAARKLGLDLKIDKIVDDHPIWMVMSLIGFGIAVFGMISIFVH